MKNGTLEAIKTIGLFISRVTGGMIKGGIGVIVIDYAASQVKEHWFKKKEEPKERCYRDCWQQGPHQEWKRR